MTVPSRPSNFEQIAESVRQINALNVPRHNPYGTSIPGSTDDSSRDGGGYVVGSTWVRANPLDSTDRSYYVCIKDDVGAAEWIEMVATSSGIPLTNINAGATSIVAFPSKSGSTLQLRGLVDDGTKLAWSQISGDQIKATINESAFTLTSFVDGATGKAAYFSSATKVEDSAATLSAAGAIGNVVSLGYYDGITATLNVSKQSFDSKAVWRHSSNSSGIEFNVASSYDLIFNIGTTSSRLILPDFTSGVLQTDASGVLSATTVPVSSTDLVDGDGLTLTGDTLSVNVDGTTIEIATDTLQVVSGVFALAGHDHAGVYQPADATLDALAALTGAGVPQATATDTWAMSTFAANRLVRGNATTGLLENAGLTQTGDGALTPSALNTNLFLSGSGTGIVQIDDNLALNALIGTPGTARMLQFEEGDAGEFYVNLRAPQTLAATYTLTLPTTDGGTSEFLQTDGSGNLTWAAAITSNQNLFETISCPAGTNPVADTATDTLTLATGTTALTITGDSSADSVTFAIADATDSVKGLASFSTDNFAVSSGAVTIKNLGVVAAEISSEAATDGWVLTADGAGNSAWEAATSSGDAYGHVTDGTTTANSSGDDTFKLRTANSILTIAVTNDDVTHGDNALFTVVETAIDHSNLANLTTGDPHTQYLLADGTRALTADWSAGAFDIELDEVGLLDTGGDHHLHLASGEDLTATDKTLTLIVGDTNRTLTLSADVTLDGTEVKNANAPVTDNSIPYFTGTDGLDLGDTGIVFYATGSLMELDTLIFGSGVGSGAVYTTLDTDGFQGFDERGIGSDTQQTINIAWATVQGDAPHDVDIICKNSGSQIYLQAASGGVIKATATGISANGFLYLDSLSHLATKTDWDLTTDITGVLPEANGGTNQSMYAVGDILYSDATDSLAKLAGNITTTRKFLSQTGTSTVSAAPVWNALDTSDIPDLSGTYVANSLFDANTLLKADSDNTPVALTVGEQTLVGRITAGSIAALSATQVRTLLNVADGANAYTHPNHSGDVTSVADGATTIANDAVTYAKMQNVVADDVLLGNVAGAGGIVAELSASTVRTLLNVADGANAYVHPNHSGDVTSVADGATTIAANAVTFAKMQAVAASVILGNDATGTAIEALTPTQVRTIINVADGANAYVHPNHSGDVTSVADGATTIAAGAVTFAKMQAVSANVILGNDATGTAIEALSASAARTVLGLATADSPTLTGLTLSGVSDGIVKATSGVLSAATAGTDYAGLASSNTFTLDQTFNAAVAWIEIISPTQITVDQNNYAPTGQDDCNVMRISSDASRTITGLDNGSAGRFIVVHNIGANDIVLADESASSTAGNRFALNADLTLGADESVWLWYDFTSSRWRAIGGTGSGSGASALNDLSDVTITSAATGDILRFNGTAWVDYPDSNYAASSHNHAASEITSGQLALARGGTGADLSATGGANQIVRQNSVGGVFTVSALADADIPNTITLDNITQITTRSHTSLSDIGTNTHAQIDTHIADATLHFTEGSIDHGSIAGLTDDDHSQYALLLGRSGGQTLIGGTGVGDDLTLQSTSNVTKGTVFVGEAGDILLGDATTTTRTMRQQHGVTKAYDLGNATYPFNDAWFQGDINLDATGPTAGRLLLGPAQEDAIYHDGTNLFLDAVTSVKVDKNLKIQSDSAYLLFGAGDDAGIIFDGTDLIVFPRITTTARFVVDSAIRCEGLVISSNLTQALTIDASGILTVSDVGAYVEVNPNSGTSDDLDTIAIGTGSERGGLYSLKRQGGTAETVTIRHNVGNILVTGGADVTLNHDNDRAFGWYDAVVDKFYVFSFVNGG